MKIYIAHNFKARLWLRGIIEKHFKEHEVTSRWIYDDSHIQEGTATDNALMDVQDISKADCLFLFVDQFGDKAGKGKYWEWGFAYACQKLIVLVGKDDSCVFWHLRNENVFRYETIEEAMDLLRARA